MSLCAHQDCPPVIAVEEPIRYLIVRQPLGDGRVKVLDVETNFSTIISASHQRSEMYTVVRDKAALAPRRMALVVGITVAAAAVVVTMVTVVATIVIGYFVNRWYKQHNVR